MTQTLTSVLEQRRQPIDGLRRTVTISLVLHLGAAALALIVPKVWPAEPEAKPVYVTINFGVADQLDTTGKTSAGGRTIEQVAPPPKRPMPIQPATPQTQSPLSIGAKPKTPPKPTATPSPSPAPPRPPTTGAEQTKGSTPADTGVKGQSTGLSIQSGGLSAAGLDSTFCCPEWAQEAQRMIMRGWTEFQPETGVNEVVVTIRRDGTFAPAEIVKPSGSFVLDNASIDPFNKLKGKLIPLPGKYEGETLRIRFRFEYKR
jgi:outer membrane biosynthesis protein TonB